MMPSLDQTKPEPSDCAVYARSRPPKKPKGSKNGSTCRCLMTDSLWMLTTAGSTLCATTTTGVRRTALTVGGMLCEGAFGVTVCDSAIGLQPKESTMIRNNARRFMEGILGNLTRVK